MEAAVCGIGVGHARSEADNAELHPGYARDLHHAYASEWHAQMVIVAQEAPDPVHILRDGAFDGIEAQVTALPQMECALGQTFGHGPRRPWR